METVAPIAMSTGVKVTASALLDEGSALRTRALKMLARLKKDPAPLVVLSSHGDWLPTFLEVLGFEGEIGKGGWVLIEFQPGVETKITSCGHATLHKLHSSDRIL